MKKIEQVYREISYKNKKGRVFTQLGLSKKLGISISTVNLAIKKLERMNAVKIKKMGFLVINKKKVIYFWASIRNLDKDVVYKTRVEKPVKEIEREVPDVIYGGYSAYKFKFKDVPADYSEVYIYSGDLKEIKRRFPKKEGKPNLFVLKKDNNMKRYGKFGSKEQIFVDLWNMKEWYAEEFIKYLQKRLGK